MSCVRCGEKTTLVCAGCQYRPCCRECQVEDWKTHKDRCARIDKLAPHLKGKVFKWPAVDVIEDWKKLGANVFEENGSYYMAAEKTFTTLPVDCSLFVQMLLNRQVYMIGRAAGLSFKYDNRKIGDMEVHCILVNNEEVRQDPVLSEFTAEWVVGPDKKNRYLGMSQNGPIRLTKEDWVRHLVACMEARTSTLPDAMLYKDIINVVANCFIISSTKGEYPIMLN